MKAKFTVINDDLVPADKAQIHISDLSIQRGYGIFDFFKTINGRPIFLEDHLDRFYNSAAALRLEPGKTREELKTVLNKLIGKNDIPDSGIRLTLTGGYSPDSYTVAPPNLIITQIPLKINKELAATGIKIITHEHQRQMPHAKTIDYLMAIWLQPLIDERQAQDVLYHKNRIVSECPRSNFFIITKDEKIMTAASNILKGVIRKNILLLNKNFDISEGDISIEDVYNAKEAFVTSSTKNILPVIQVDDKVIGDGRPGVVSAALSKALEKVINE